MKLISEKHYPLLSYWLNFLTSLVLVLAFGELFAAAMSAQSWGVYLLCLIPGLPLSYFIVKCVERSINFTITREKYEAEAGGEKMGGLSFSFGRDEKNP